jgi:DNA-binding CsgD family transcriptional regulator
MKPTPRELAILQLAAEGCDHQASAALLRLSKHTIKNYLYRLFEKIDARSIAHAVAIGFRKGWLN